MFQRLCGLCQPDAIKVLLVWLIWPLNDMSHFAFCSQKFNPSDVFGLAVTLVVVFSILWFLRVKS